MTFFGMTDSRTKSCRPSRMQLKPNGMVVLGVRAGIMTEPPWQSPSPTALR